MFTTELNILLLAGVLTLIQFVISGILGLFQTGIHYAVSPRDEPRLLTGIPARLNRALHIQYERLFLFAIEVIALSILDKSNPTTLLAAQIYLAARGSMCRFMLLACRGSERSSGALDFWRPVPCINLH